MLASGVAHHGQSSLQKRGRSLHSRQMLPIKRMRNCKMTVKGMWRNQQGGEEEAVGGGEVAGMGERQSGPVMIVEKQPQILVEIRL
jgi:hypothetical protein